MVLETVPHIVPCHAPEIFPLLLEYQRITVLELSAPRSQTQAMGMREVPGYKHEGSGWPEWRVLTEAGNCSRGPHRAPLRGN